MATDTEQASLDRTRALVVPEMVARAARLHAARRALVFRDETRTHAELDARAARLAAALRDRGVGPGDRVALLLHNGLEFVESFLAVHRIGACAVPVNFRLAREEIDYILADCGALALIAGPELADDAVVLAATLPAVRVHLATAPGGSYEAALATTQPLAVPPAVAEGDAALICYTSGTTGRPKGAVLSHRSLVSSTLSWIHEMRAGLDDVWLSGQPLFHIGGINGLLPFLFLGATSVLTPTAGFDADATIDLIRRHEATMCIFVPTQWDAICAGEHVSGLDRSRLRVAMWGASPASLETLERMRATFPAAEIVSAYGQTEMAGATTLLKGRDATRKIGSVGKPMLGVELRLVDDGLVDVPDGAVGEVVYRGPTVMTAYHDDPAATAEAFAGGWFHSGDLATRDDEGYLRLVDRKKDLIISGGENVYPAEVERVLLEHPDVEEAAVVGVPHPRWVETPLAFVVPVRGRTVDARGLIEHCRRRLAAYKKPSDVVVVQALPRNATGKVLKRELQRAHGEWFADLG
jgi:acyl-CoA synthetase (AMP-forming)/AMP-acid ligase II